MCVEGKRQTRSLVAVPTLSSLPIPPTLLVVPVVPPPVPSLQLNPILAPNGIPIANQKWSGTQYIRVTDPSEFQYITKNADPKIATYLTTFQKPIVHNIVDIRANTLFDINQAVLSNNFNVENARALANFGNSCYFGVSMHLLFVMYGVRNQIVSNKPYLVTGLSQDLQDAYSDIKNLFIEMNTSPKTQPIISLPNYLSIKKQIFKLPDPVSCSGRRC